MKSNCQEFIGLLFASRDVAHKAHLNTSSFAAHMALGGFYDAVIDLADKFAESYMGRTGKKIGDIPTMQSPAKGDPAAILRRHLDVIEDIRDFVDAKDTALNNIVDEIVDLYLSTLYKLEQLK